MNLLWRKANIKHFGFNNLHQDFDIMRIVFLLSSYCRIQIHIYFHNTYILTIIIMVRMFTNGPGDLGSIISRDIPKPQKILFNASLFNSQQYKVWIKGKWSNPEKRVAPSSTPRCSSYCKGSLWVTYDWLANGWVSIPTWSIQHV